MTLDEAIRPLPPPIAARLMRHRLIAPDVHGYVSTDSLVSGAFEWEGTPQRWDFWNNVFRAARGEREYPSVKGVPE